ncbi:MAG TPA: ABC transporter ATP-binding protein [Tepidisphaeraceae bacterium]|nr:ABC transporter ATP-binding protein [Tepidisphaeraceae bacterium]
MAGKILVHNLVKRYGDFEALRGVSFEVPEGKIVGLLGPNGAGKTTTLECVIGLRQPDGGAIEVCGIDALAHPDQVKQRLGAQLQATALQDKITPREALHLFASFYQNPADIDSLIERFSLTEKADATFDSLSGGQKQRLALALAFVNRPEVLFLDEPTTGLDPQSRRDLHAAILRMRDEGHTVLLTTHYIEEAQRLCDSLAIIDHGRIIATGSPAELIEKSRAVPQLTVRTARGMDVRQVKALPGIEDASTVPDGMQLKSRNVSRAVIAVVNLLESHGNELLDLQIHRPSLEDVFIELTGTSLRD